MKRTNWKHQVKMSQFFPKVKKVLHIVSETTNFTARFICHYCEREFQHIYTVDDPVSGLENMCEACAKEKGLID